MTTAHRDIVPLDESTARRELESLFRAKDRRELLACFRARGSSGTVEVPVAKRESDVPFDIVPTTCELELREKLPPFQRARSAERGVLFLVPWLDREDSLPFDLQGRFAKGQVIEVGADRRLAAALGIREVTLRVTQSALASAILAGRIHGFGASDLLRPDLDQLLDRYLEERMGLAATETRVEALLPWAVAAKDEDALGEERVDDPSARDQAARLVEELGQRLERRGGPLGRAALDAAIRGGGTNLWVALLLAEAYLDDSAPDTHAREAFLAALGDEVPDLQRILSWFDRMGGKERSALLDRAEELGRDGGGTSRTLQLANSRARELAGKFSVLRRRLERSPRLEIGHEARRAHFDTTIATFLKVPTTASWRPLRDAFRALRAHRGAGDEVERWADLVRLAAWLITRKADPKPPDRGIEQASHEVLVRDYAREGGFVDLARRRLRGCLGKMKGAQALLEAIDEVRDAADRRFAALHLDVVCSQKWKGKPFLPIHEILRSAGAGFLKAKEQRKLLVLVLDGASQADLAELLEDLHGRNDQANWGPIGWRPKLAESMPPGHLPPVLAELPTETAVSRASLLEGKPRKPGETLGTARDPKRFAANTAWNKVLDPEAPRTLLLNGEALADDQQLSDRAYALIEGPARLAGLVLNAIDDQLSGSSSVQTRTTLDGIPVLAEILATARTAGRAVLLVSDHGHVRSERLSVRKAEDIGNARFRFATDEDALAEDEVLLPAKICWRKAGKPRVAVLVGERSRYAQKGGTGCHGGLSLAEVVAPAMLLGPSDLASQVGGLEDPGLERVAQPLPAWWDVERTLVAPPPPAPPERVEKAVEGGFSFEPAPSRTPAKEEEAFVPVEKVPADAPLHKVLEAVRATADYEDLTSDFSPERVAQAERIVDTLLRVPGHRIGLDSLARVLDCTSYQVQGLLGRAMEVLNQGEQALNIDHATREAVLDVSLLESSFGLDD